MEINQITFPRIESDYQIGNIRSISVDHVRGIITVVSDDKPKELPEGSTIPTTKVFSTQYDEGDQQ